MANTFGLRLSLGGAPNTPHNVVNPLTGEDYLPGLYSPNELVEVPNEKYGISLAQAQEWSKAKGVPLELVELDEKGNEVEKNAVSLAPESPEAKVIPIVLVVDASNEVNKEGAKARKDGE